MMMKHKEWKWTNSKGPTNTLPNIPFSGGDPGPAGRAVGIIEPLECFHLLLPDQFYNDLLVETNRYAQQQRAKKNDTTQWSPLSKEELMAFIGINIAMGIVSLHSLDNYWSTDPILSHGWFRIVMSRNRFHQILRYVHVVDNDTAPNRDDSSYGRFIHF